MTTALHRSFIQGISLCLSMATLTPPAAAGNPMFAGSPRAVYNRHESLISKLSGQRGRYLKAGKRDQAERVLIDMIKVYESALGFFERGLKQAVRTRAAKLAQKFRSFIVVYCVRLAPIYFGRLEYKKTFETTMRAHRAAPNDHGRGRVLYRMRYLSAYWAGHQAFGKHRYDEALRYYRAVPTAGYPRLSAADMIRAIKKRKRLGRIRPEYVHRVLVLFLTRIDYTTLREGKKVRIQKVMTANDKRKARISLGSLARCLEAFSNGKFSLAFKEVEVTEPIASRRAGSNRQVGEAIFRHINQTDTILLASTFGGGSARGGAARFHYIPHVLGSAVRGSIVNHPGQNMGMWMHEFFHVVEQMAGIGPAHPWAPAVRKKYFPGWKGKTQFTYFRWQFMNTLPKKGWRKMNFRFKAPERLSPKAFAAIKRAYRNISIAQRKKANLLVARARKLGRTPQAYALYRKALKLSPYLPSVLRAVADYLAGTKRNRKASLPYYKRLVLVRRSVWAYLNYGKALFETGNYRGALAAFDEASKSMAGGFSGRRLHADALYWKALTLGSKFGKRAEAHRLIKKAARFGLHRRVVGKYLRKFAPRK